MKSDDIHTKAARRMFYPSMSGNGPTGRLTSSEPNRQDIEREPEELGTGPFIDADYSQIELRVMSSLISTAAGKMVGGDINGALDDLKEGCEKVDRLRNSVEHAKKSWSTGIMRTLMEAYVLKQRSDKFFAQVMLRGMFVDHAYVDDPIPMKVEPTVSLTWSEAAKLKDRAAGRAERFAYIGVDQGNHDSYTAYAAYVDHVAYACHIEDCPLCIESVEGDEPFPPDL